MVADIDEVQVLLGGVRRFPAKMLGLERRSDIALLKIDATGLRSAVIGDSSKLAPGDWVAAIGEPFGFPGTVTVTAGVVSAIGVPGSTGCRRQPCRPSGRAMT